MKRVPNRINTDVWREIKNTRSRFLSLFLLSALAVAFLAGLRTTAPDMKYTADDYYDRTHLMDVRILSTLGLTEEDISALAAAEGVEKAEGAWYVDGVVHAADDSDLVVRFHSLSEQGINLPELTAGRLPENGGECVVEPALLEMAGLSLGDRICLDMTGTDYEDSLRQTEFTVVGTVTSSLYMSTERGTTSVGNGRLSGVAFLCREAYDMEVYTEAYLLAEGAEELLCYSEDYENLTDRLITALEPLGEERAGNRYNEVVDEANKTLNDAQREFDAAEAETAEKLAEAQQELADARKQLDDGRKEYEDGQKKLSQETKRAEQSLKDAEAELAEALAKLEQGEVDYAEGKKTLETGKSKLEQSKAEYEAGTAKLAESRLTLEEQERAYSAGLARLEDAQRAFDDGKARLAASREEYERGVAAYEAGKAEYEAGNALLKLKDSLSLTLSTAEQTADFVAFAAAEPEQALSAVENLRTALKTIGEGVEDTAKRTEIEGLIAALPVDTVTLQTMAKEHSEALGQSLWGGYGVLAQSCAELEPSLKQAEETLNATAEQLSEAKTALETGEAELAESEQTLTEARTQSEQGRAALDTAWEQLTAGEAELVTAGEQLATAEVELNAGKEQMAESRKALENGWKEYEDGVTALETGKAELKRETAKGEEKLKKALAELEQGEVEYAEGLAEYERGKAEAEEKISDARRELNDARREISEIEDCKWYILGRNTNTGYVSYEQDAQRMGNLAQVFPLIFFLVAALVCLTTMTRMVEEQRVQIGGLKALGYDRGAIAKKYVGYGFLASFGGGVTGLLVGCTLIPTIIFNAWKVMYTVGDLQIAFLPDIYLVAVGAAVLCVAGTAWAASYAALTAVPAALMRPKAPPAGKRVLLERVDFIWKRLSFTWKVTVRNLFRYKKRFCMAVVGIGGCTALLITGFGLRDSIHGFFDKQYDEITTYHGTVSLGDQITAEEISEIERELARLDTVEDWVSVSNSMISVESETRAMDSNVYLTVVTDEEKTKEFIRLRDRKTGAEVPLSDGGAVITEKLAEMLGVTVGERITVVVTDGKRVEIPVVGVTENYIFHYLYLTEAGYETYVGEPAEVNSILVRYTEDTVENSDAAALAVLPLSGVVSVSRTDSLRQSVLRGLEGVDYAVIVVVVAAAALAFVVLYNLTNINITERLRELATLKVLGFNDRELNQYIYRENIFLTGFGILLGLLMGKYLHRWLVLTVEIDMAMFYRQAEPMSYVFSAVLTVVFSVLVNAAAKKKLRKIDMVESLKTVE